jgi:hypothetical protein
MRRAKRPVAPAGFTADRAARGRVDAENFKVLLERRGRHDRRETFRDHRFARAWRAQHQQIVRPRHRHLDGATHRVLTFDFGKIRRRLTVDPGACGRSRRSERRQRRFTGQETHRPIERVDPINGHIFDQGRLFSRYGRQQHAPFAERPGQPRHCERTAHRARGTREAQLARDEVVAKVRRVELAGGSENTQRDRQIIARPLFTEMAGGEIDRRARARRPESAVAQCRKYTVVGFLHRRIRQSD